jgi:hypothetical protein
MTELPSPGAVLVAALLDLSPDPGVHLAYVDGLDQLVGIARQTVADLGEDYGRERLIRLFADADPGKTGALLATALVRLAEQESPR